MHTSTCLPLAPAILLVHQVSTPGLDEATAYMLEQVQALKDLAAARQDVDVEV